MAGANFPCLGREEDGKGEVAASPRSSLGWAENRAGDQRREHRV